MLQIGFDVIKVPSDLYQNKSINNKKNNTINKNNLHLKKN